MVQMIREITKEIKEHRWPYVYGLVTGLVIAFSISFTLSSTLLMSPSDQLKWIATNNTLNNGDRVAVALGTAYSIIMTVNPEGMSKDEFSSLLVENHSITSCTPCVNVWVGGQKLGNFPDGHVETYEYGGKQFTFTVHADGTKGNFNIDIVQQ